MLRIRPTTGGVRRKPRILIVWQKIVHHSKSAKKNPIISKRNQIKLINWFRNQNNKMYVGNRENGTKQRK